MTSQALLTIVSALLGGTIALLSAIVSGFFSLKTSKSQIEVAKINAEKEAFLQQEKTNNEVSNKNVLDTLEKLLEIHTTVSRIAKDYSQTRSHIDWTDGANRADFRSKYREDCDEINKSMAMIDVYLAEYKEYRQEINESLSEIYGNMNYFWGNQEELLRNHEIMDEETRGIHKGARITAVTEASKKISKQASNIQRKIVEAVIAVKKNQKMQQGNLVSYLQT